MTITKNWFAFIKNIFKTLGKSILVPLGLTVTASSTNAAIQKKIYGLGTTTLAFSIEDLNDIMKIVKFLEESGLLIKGVSETVENEIKEQKGGLLSMLAATLAANLLGSVLTGKGVIRASEGQVF